MTEYYKFHEDVPRIYMEPMSSTVHMYYDFKRRLTYIRVTKMLAKQRKKKREESGEENKATKIKDPAKVRTSDEHNKTSKNKTGSKDVVIVEEKQDLLDFDCDADLEDFGTRKQKKIYLNKSLKKVLPESLIYSLNNWKGRGRTPKDGSSGGLDEATRLRINTGRKYIKLNDDSCFFIKDFFGSDLEKQSEIWESEAQTRGGDFKTLPFQFSKKGDDTKSETLMDLNAILNGPNDGLCDLSQGSKLESFMIPQAGNPSKGKIELIYKEKPREGKMQMKKRKKQVAWEEVGESPKKDFKIEDSFYRHLKAKDIQKILNRRSKNSMQNQRIGDALIEKIKNKKILDQLKNCSNKILNGKNLFKRKQQSSIKNKGSQKTKDALGEIMLLTTKNVEASCKSKQKENTGIFETYQTKKDKEVFKSRGIFCPNLIY